MKMQESSITLRDGRRMGYAEYGDPDGVPVFLIHGIPGSRLTWGVIANPPFRPGLRLIAPDRPGYGNSDFFRRGQSIIDYPNDIEQLADQLGIDRFALFGPSGAGPYVLACAWKIPARLMSVGVFASVAPNVPEATVGLVPSIKHLYSIAARFSRLIRVQMAVMALLVKWFPALYVKLIKSEFSEPDIEVYARLDLSNALRADRAETYRRFGRGVAYDVTIPGRWPIPLDEIRPKIHIWQGEQDRTVPPAAGRYLADKISDTDLTMIPDAGHLWIFDHLQEMLEGLVPVPSASQDATKAEPAGSSRDSDCNIG